MKGRDDSSDRADHLKMQLACVQMYGVELSRCFCCVLVGGLRPKAKMTKVNKVIRGNALGQDQLTSRPDIVDKSLGFY